MTKNQKVYLYFVIVISVLHLIRDICQDLGVENFLSTFLASPGPPKVNSAIYWTVFNTYVIELAEIVISVYCLKRNNFGKLGWLTAIMGTSIFFAWLVYYFLL